MNPYYHNIDKILVSFGPFKVAWYGIMYVISFVFGYLFIKRNYAKKGVEMSLVQYDNLFVRIFIGMFIGARLGFVLLYHPDYYLLHPWEILFVWQGGLSFHGGLLGVIFSCVLYCKKNKFNFFEIADQAMPLVALSLGFGRIGNFINGELYGSVTNLPWAVVFTEYDPLPRHPSQLYEALLEGFLMAIFLQIMLYKTKVNGMIFWLFIGSYGVVRFLLEFVRLPDADLIFYRNGPLFGHFSMGQVLSMGMIISAIIAFIVYELRSHKKPN